MTYFKNISLVLIAVFLVASIANAQSADELRSKINDRNDAIAKLEAEIKQIVLQIDETERKE